MLSERLEHALPFLKIVKENTLFRQLTDHVTWAISEVTFERMLYCTIRDDAT